MSATNTTVSFQPVTGVTVRISNMSVGDDQRSIACASNLSLYPNQPLLVPGCSGVVGQYVYVGRPSTRELAELMLCRVDVTATADKETIYDSDPAAPCPYSSIASVPGTWARSCYSGGNDTLATSLNAAACTLAATCAMMNDNACSGYGADPSAKYVKVGNASSWWCYEQSSLDLKACALSSIVENVNGVLKCTRPQGE